MEARRRLKNPREAREDGGRGEDRYTQGEAKRPCEID